ncbi:MAG: phosphate ABC transporter permease PstA [Actinomycetes bacterium]
MASIDVGPDPAPAGQNESTDPPEIRRLTATTTPLDRALLFGSACSAFALTWLLWTQLLPTQGAPGFLALWYVTFLTFYFLVALQTEGRLGAVDKLVTVVVMSGAIGLLVPLVLIIGFIVVRGVGGINATFFTQDLATTGTLDAGGGLAHAMVGTIEQVGIAVLLSVPLGVLTAVFMNEVRGPLVRPVRVFVDAMSGVPSIVAGLFIYAVWLVQFGHGFSGFAASLALAVLMLPTVTRTAEEVLRLVPTGLREASLALGSPEWRTTWAVVLPTARSGLITAVILGIARAVGETAPLIMTSFGATDMNVNPFEGAQASLPLSVYQLISNPFAAQQQRAYAGALVLVVLVLVLFTAARILGRSRKPKPAAPRPASRLETDS